MIAYFFRYIFLVFLICSVGQLNAQQSPDSTVSAGKGDSTKPVNPSDSTQTSLKYDADSASFLLVRKLEELTLGVNKVNAAMKRGLDTTDIHKELPNVKRLLELISASLYKQEFPLNLRSLNGSRVVLLQLEKQLGKWQASLQKYNATLLGLRADIREIVRDSSLQLLSNDSLIMDLYFDELTAQEKKWKLTETTYNNQLARINNLLHDIGIASLDVTDLLEEVNYRINALKKGLLSKTETYLHEASKGQAVSLWESIKYSIKPNQRLFFFFLRFNWVPSLVIGILGILLYFWVRYNISKIRREKRDELLLPVRYLKRNTLLGCLLLVFTIVPFFSGTPPATFIEINWMVMLILASRLAWPDWSDRYHHFWWVVVALFFINGIGNLLVSTSEAERWIMALGALVAIYVGYQLHREVKLNEKAYPAFQDEALALFGLVNLVALFLNIFGRYTLAKMISNSAVIALAHALSFYLLVDIIIEAVYLQLEGNKNTRISAILQFGELRDKFKRFLVVIAIVLWFLAFTWSLNLLDSIITLGQDFLSAPRSIGSVEFTLSSILIFGIVLWGAFFLSNLLTFFFRGGSNQLAGNAAKNKAGSWVLLIRLVVIAIGFLLAMGAAGIPLDKLAIVIGALGVGIGFGLQNIVNNLVSGVILAFEKPMDVGDVIEIGTNTGTVKEIGIRSSKIGTFDGADIIVPNGDFISQKLINWTHNNNYRRVELLIGVAYGTNLDKAQQIIQDVIEKEEGIVSHPEPAILWHEMANSSVNVRVLFWTNNFGNWVNLKSNMLKTIYNRFNQEGITIPFPQQDLHIRSVDASLLDTLQLGKGRNSKEGEGNNAG